MTALPWVRRWIHGVLLEDTNLMALLGVQGDEFQGVYDEKAPESAPGDYIVIGGKEEREGGATFASAGTDGLENIRIHTRPAEGERPGTAKGDAIYGHIHRLLHGAESEIAPGLILWNAKLRMVTSFVEQDRPITTMPAQFTYNTLRT